MSTALLLGASAVALALAPFLEMLCQGFQLPYKPKLALSSNRHVAEPTCLDGSGPTSPSRRGLWAALPLPRSLPWHRSFKLEPLSLLL